MLKLVKNVKNHIAALIKNEDFIELFDIEDNSVIFSVSTPDQIAEGVSAQPDGEYIFSDGMKVVIAGGKVISVEKPESEIVEVEIEKTEEPAEVEMEKDAEASSEPAKAEESETVVEEENNEYEEKEKLLKENEELKIKVEELIAEIEKLKEENEKKDADIAEAKNCLTEVQNFYSKVSNSAKQSRVSSEDDEDKNSKPNFRIIK